MILLDLDGVCCDFVLQTLNLHDKSESGYAEMLLDNEDDRHPYRLLEDYIGIENGSKFWEWIESQGVEFWREMPVFSWFEHLYSELRKISEVKFLTSAPTMTFAHYGKAEWVKKHVGKDALYDLIICPSPMKKMLAKSGRVLIDDTTSNIEEWNEHGGHAFHFPSLQFFNRHPNDLDIIQAIEFAREYANDK